MVKLIDLRPRGCDKHGCGHYQAARRGRVHNGIDLECWPGETIDPCFSGRVVKIGWPYSGEEEIRYVAIEISKMLHCRIFYIEPMVEVGDIIISGVGVGKAQSLDRLYQGITEHIHVEFYTFKSLDGGMHDKSNFEYINPNFFLDILRGK